MEGINYSRRGSCQDLKAGEFDNLYKANVKLLDENKILKKEIEYLKKQEERNKKAIEYIKSNKNICAYYEECVFYKTNSELLRILGDEDYVEY